MTYPPDPYDPGPRYGRHSERPGSSPPGGPPRGTISGKVLLVATVVLIGVCLICTILGVIVLEGGGAPRSAAVDPVTDLISGTDVR